MRLRYAPEDEAFRAELDAWLDEHQPSDERIHEPKQSSAHMPQWARAWQRSLFDAGWLVPGVFFGSATWWWLLSWIAGRLGARLQHDGLRAVNLASGAVIAGFGAWQLAQLLGAR